MKSVNEVLASYTELGKPIPAELKDVEFEFRYDISSLFNCYQCKQICPDGRNKCIVNETI